VDSATIEDIRPLYEAGIINGATTNPTLLKRAGAKSWDEAKKILKEILNLMHPDPVSLELTKTTIEEMVDQHTSNSEYVASGGARKDSGVRLIREIAAIFANYDIHSEVLAASVRNTAQLTEILLAGADILTVPAHVLNTLADHPLSDEGTLSFDSDAKVFST